MVIFSFKTSIFTPKNIHTIHTSTKVISRFHYTFPEDSINNKNTDKICFIYLVIRGSILFGDRSDDIHKELYLIYVCVDLLRCTRLGSRKSVVVNLGWDIQLL